MALIPPIVTVMEKACKNASKSLIRDFGELEKLQISRKDMNDFVSYIYLRVCKHKLHLIYIEDELVS